MPAHASAQKSARQRFGDRLRAGRLSAGLTQQQLGVAIGLERDVAATRINRYERGVHDADGSTAEKLAAELGLPLAYFYSDNELLAEAVLEFAKLPPDIQAEALEAIRALASKSK